MPFFNPSIFRYTQTVASADWVIQHNLGNNGSTGIPMVDAFIESNGQLTKVLPQITTMNDANSVTLTFTSPQTGFAVVIV